MKKRQKISIYLLMLFGVFLVFASGCKKDDDTANTINDPRDGTVYKTVTLGTQVWMAENLKYLPKDPGVRPQSEGSYTEPYYYVYGYEGASVSGAKATDNYNTYGVLYNWTAAMNDCPDGWHLPSDEEWTQLTDYLGGESVAGGKLKETGTTHWNSPNTGATNETGFTALPGAYRSGHGGGFFNIGFTGVWWSATENTTESAKEWWVSNQYSDLYGFLSSPKDAGYSVRCVRD